MTRRTFENLGAYKMSREERKQIDKLLATPPRVKKSAPKAEQLEIAKDDYTTYRRASATEDGSASDALNPTSPGASHE